MKRLLVAWWVAASLGAVARGDDRPIRFARLSLEEGLSQSSVLTMLQDREGFLWFGTEGGLNRYDGRSFSHYYHDSSAANSLPSNYIYALDEDADGDLWIATDGGGLARWQRSSDHFTSFRHDPGNDASLAGNHLRSLHVDAGGSVWIGTRGQGLDRLDPRSGTVVHYRHDPADASTLSQDEVFVVLSDRAGRIWAGTNGGLNRLDPASDKFVRYHHDPADPDSLADDQIRSLFEDRDGKLWVGTLKGGLHRLADLESGRFERFRHRPQDPASLSHDRVRAIFEDDAGRMWVGTGAGLDLMDWERRRFAHYRHDPARPDSLPRGEIMIIRQDRGGVIWIGSQHGGLTRWNPRTWSFGHYAAETSGLSHPVVTSFATGPAGRLWVGTMGGGLNELDRETGEWRHHRAGAGGLSDDRVMSMLLDSGEKLWIGTASQGLDVFDPKSGRFENVRADPERLGANAIMSLFEDRGGNVWIGTFGGGASRFDRSTESLARIADKGEGAGADLAAARVTCFAEGSAGAIWAGTDGQGLYLLDAAGSVVRRYVQGRNDPAALTSDTIYALHADSSGDLWIGTRGGWLNRVEGSSEVPDEVSFAQYNARRNGLLDADVYGIESDAEGHLWLASNRGLTRFHPARGSVKHYSQHHGLQANEFNFGAHHRSAGGELLFGGIQGFNAFSPAELEENGHQPPVVLRSLQVNNQPVPIPPTGYGAAGVQLGHRDDVVTFEFAALDFAAPEENRYAYMLEGFDAGWIELGNNPRVTYTNLDAGRYRLKVEAANNDGVWSEQPLEIPLRVEPAPWRTWWAYSAYLAAAALAAAVFVRSQQQKVRREAEYSRKLESEVQARTRELSDRNSELAALNEKLEEASLTDPLTGLRNRRFLFEQVTKDISLVRRRYHDVAAGREEAEVLDLVFMMLDLDRFKSINDSYGHAAGDRVLLAMRDVLLETCRDSDIIIRWGGDEFLIVARDADSTAAEGLAERLRDRIADRTLELDGAEVHTTCSIGFACFPFVHSHPDVVSWDHVIQLADSALYRAKERRNAWVGYLSTAKTAEEEAALQTDHLDPKELVRAGSLEIRSSRGSTEAA